MTTRTAVTGTSSIGVSFDDINTSHAFSGGERKIELGKLRQATATAFGCRPREFSCTKCGRKNLRARESARGILQSVGNIVELRRGGCRSRANCFPAGVGRTKQRDDGCWPCRSWHTAFTLHYTETMEEATKAFAGTCKSLRQKPTLEETCRIQTDSLQTCNK